LREQELRVDFTPEVQAGDGLLLKCAWSHNFRYPPNGCFGRPFLLHVEDSELFELTRVRLYSMIPDRAWGTPIYVLFAGRSVSNRFFELRDEIPLSDVARDPEAMLFVMIDPAALMRSFQRSRQTSLKINN
jgi:hypothetical protein